MQSLLTTNEKKDFEMINPVYKNGSTAKVGHTVIKDNVTKKIIRIDKNTRQVWFKFGGFEWFEDMKSYMEV
ncbi:hypothetical protein GCM10007161_13060 [Ignatzschineria indica]|uniref:hypothetical protein n=2 Tax=Ignatzschineria indica TaxID=472583 RepID=UPI001057BAF9|nr:hypothetical protein [Ignatzschineria indica]GGZ82995.1 hypothetical protein GCM10007161_13060 [Ignatzschineria indica]